MNKEAGLIRLRPPTTKPYATSKVDATPLTATHIILHTSGETVVHEIGVTDMKDGMSRIAERIRREACAPVV